jgi:hypothetical protein
MVEIRRKVTRYRRNKNVNSEVMENSIYKEYRNVLKSYKNSIRKAKRDSWNKTLKELDKEPCGIAFKIATLKIRPAIHIARHFLRGY